MDKLHTGKY
jgi:hypothetical protein